MPSNDPSRDPPKNPNLPNGVGPELNSEELVTTTRVVLRDIADQKLSRQITEILAVLDNDNVTPTEIRGALEALKNLDVPDQKLRTDVQTKASRLKEIFTRYGLLSQ